MAVPLLGPLAVEDAGSTWGIVLVTLVAFGALVGMAALGLRRTAPPHPVPLRPARPVPAAVLQPMFTSLDDESLVVDGLIEVSELPDGMGVPVTLRLTAPDDTFLAALVLEVLERWSDEDRAIDLDISKLRRDHPSIGLSGGDTFVRLGVESISTGMSPTS